MPNQLEHPHFSFEPKYNFDQNLIKAYNFPFTITK